MQKIKIWNLPILVIVIILVVISGCKKDEPNVAPGAVTLTSPNNEQTRVALDKILIWLDVSDPNGDAITYDVYFGTDASPKTIVQSGQKGRTYKPTLVPNTTYYWKVVAMDGNGGTSESTVWSFTTDIISWIDATHGIFTDTRDSKVYDVIEIGNQVWFAENLAYLPSVSPSVTESTTVPYYYVSDYQGTDVAEAKATTNYQKYGVLYNWPAAMNNEASSNSNPSNVQGVCPSGWHLPSDAEWTEFENYLITNGYNYDITTTNNKIAKSIAATSGWELSSTTGAVGNNQAFNNLSGFTGLPGGARGNFGVFAPTGSWSIWWSSTEFSASAHGRFLDHNHIALVRGSLGYSKEGGLSIRCVRD